MFFINLLDRILVQSAVLLETFFDSDFLFSIGREDQGTFLFLVICDYTLEGKLKGGFLLL